jgi:hypothetical protein
LAQFARLLEKRRRVKGRARHSVRAGAMNLTRSLAKERRAEDRPPDLRRCVNLKVNCYSAKPFLETGEFYRPSA